VTDTQKTILNRLLLEAGLSQRQAEDIDLLLSFKPENVQLSFYYRMCGDTQQEIADRLHVNQSTVKYYMSESIEDLKKYLKNMHNLA